MSAYAYCPPDSTFLLERYLRERPDAERVCLVGEAGGPASLPLARTSLDLTPLDASNPEPGATITLPLSLDSFPLRYRPPHKLPDIRPIYPLLRRLWKRGFRSFELYSLHGTRTIELPHILDEFVDKHRGRRAFVVGNGPSLNQIDMTRLRDEITFGANRGYMGCADWGFQFSYWGIYDHLQIEEYSAEYESDAPKGVTKFFPLQYLPLLDVNNACPVPMDWPRQADREFSVDPGRLIVGYSVLYMLLQLAALMGCDPIYTIGLDHRYELAKAAPLSRAIRLGGRALARRFDQTALYRAGEAAAWKLMEARAVQGSGAGRIWEAGDTQAPTHFTQQYTSERKRFLMPRPRDAARDYACAAAWAKANGSSIANATPGTALETLPLADFDKLFN